MRDWDVAVEETRPTLPIIPRWEKIHVELHVKGNQYPARFLITFHQPSLLPRTYKPRLMLLTKVGVEFGCPP